MAEYQNSTMSEEITLEERQLRLGQVYGLLITLARRKRVEQGQLGEPTHIVSNTTSVVGG